MADGEARLKLRQTAAISCTQQGPRFLPTSHTFTGWNTRKDGKGTPYADGEAVKDLAAEGETITLYAQWAKVL